MSLLFVVGGVAAAFIGKAIFSGDDDDDDFDSVREQRLANLKAGREKRKRQIQARKRAEARRKEQRQKEAREEFEGILSSKLRAFKMKAKIGGSFGMHAGDCSFKDFNKDFLPLTEQVKNSIKERFQDERKECAQLTRQIKELNSIVSILKGRGR